MIRPVRLSDADQICKIYNYYIENTVVTFEEQPVSETGMKGRIEEIPNKFPWLIHSNDEDILGYAYITQWKARAAYKNTVEITVYTKPNYSRRGIGTKLYEKLIETLMGKEIHAVLAGIALPNDASVAFHEKFGFRKVAHFREVGYKFNKWIDVGYWQLLIPE